MNTDSNFIFQLEKIIRDRKKNPRPGSYTNSLLSKGTKKIAQKVGEEAVELIIDAVAFDEKNFKNEVADLMYHLLVLLADRNITLNDITGVLEERHK